MQIVRDEVGIRLDRNFRNRQTRGEEETAGTKGLRTPWKISGRKGGGVGKGGKRSFPGVFLQEKVGDPVSRPGLDFWGGQGGMRSKRILRSVSNCTDLASLEKIC